MIRCKYCDVDVSPAQDWVAHQQTRFHVINMRRKRGGEPALSYEGYFEMIKSECPDLFQPIEQRLVVREEHKYASGQCLFCSFAAKQDQEENENALESWQTEAQMNALQRHMKEEHQWEVPHAKYCLEAREFIEFLQHKMLELFECQRCMNRFETLELLQQHVRRRAHWRLEYDPERHWKYFDFTETYPPDVPVNRRVPYVKYTREYLRWLEMEGLICFKREPHIPQFLRDIYNQERNSARTKSAMMLQSRGVTNALIHREGNEKEAKTLQDKTVQAQRACHPAFIALFVAVVLAMVIKSTLTP